MQEVFWVDSHTYGFSWDGAELTDFDFGKISQFSPVPIKPSRGDALLVKVGDRDALVDLDLGRFPDDIRDARIGQEA